MASITIQELRQQMVPAPSNFTPFALQHIAKLDILCLAGNPSPAAFTYIQKHRPNFLYTMASHPSAIPYLENTEDNIDFDYLSNAVLENPKISKKLLDIELAYNNTPNFYDILSNNPSDPAVDHLLGNPEKINW